MNVKKGQKSAKCKTVPGLISATGEQYQEKKAHMTPASQKKPHAEGIWERAGSNVLGKCPLMAASEKKKLEDGVSRSEALRGPFVREPRI